MAGRATDRALLGLRVDVDTHEGMGRGVPRLMEVMGAAGVQGTFYLSMGPDRSGMAIFNLLRPGFLAKMHRTRAARVYGLRTVLSGTLLPARPIATAFPEVARALREAGHEVGVHAWDHRRWQDRLPRLADIEVAEQLERGRQAFSNIFGEPPKTYAAPAWLSSDASLRLEDGFGLTFASDCRGSEPFVPVVRGAALRTPQVPATLPTLDEALGFTHDAAPPFFASVLDAVSPGAWPVFTIHAELEGGAYADDFAGFLRAAAARDISVVTLGELLAARQRTGVPLPRCGMTHAPVPGRHGVVSFQGPELPTVQ